MSWLFKDPVVIMKDMSWLFKYPINFKDPIVIMKYIMSWLFKDPINSSLAQFWSCPIKQYKMA